MPHILEVNDYEIFERKYSILDQCGHFLWTIFLLDEILPIYLTQLGIHPRSLWGIPGIFFAPFLHGSALHIMSNSFALFFLLLASLTYDRKHTLMAISSIIMINGIGTWLFGSTGTHIGASSVIFGLIGYLLFLWYYQRDLTSFIVSIIVLITYCSTLLLGPVPIPGISWTGHFFGFCAGAFSAELLRRNDTKEDIYLSKNHF